MNSLQDIAELNGFNYTRSAQCCPHKGYRESTVLVTVRVSSTTRYIFSDGRTLTVGHKTRYATFPRQSHYYDIASEAMDELTEKHPLSKNRYVVESI